MTQSNWIIRPYQAGDETQAAALFERCFGRSMSEAHYLWKMQVDLGRPASCVVALVGDVIVGQYAGWWIEATINGQRRPLVIAIDAMVDPDHRRQGILTSLVKSAHQVWQDEGAVCVMALLNEQWGSLREKLGWKKSFSLKWHIRPLRLEQIALRRLGVPISTPAPLSWLWNRYWQRFLQPDNGVVVEVVSQAGEAIDELWERLNGNWPHSIVRDAAWINWRYLSAPDRPYRVLLARRNGRTVGYIVYWLQSFPGGQAGIVADFLYADGGARDSLTAAVLEQLQAVGAETMIGLAVPGTAQSDDLRRIGALFSWGAFDLWILPLDDAAPFKLLEQPVNWLMHGGDFDVV